jgi:hypothetical protein
MDNNESVIEIIQKMVQEGQSREQIILTLKDLGVSEEQAKKLLLIAEADTFTLLKKEINSLVKEEFKSNQKDFENLIHNDLQKIEDSEKEKIRSLAVSEIGEAKSDIIQESKAFEDRINKTISSSQKTVQMVKIALDSINERISQMELDVEQLKVHKFRKKSMFFSYAMLALGAVLLIISIAFFAMFFNDLDLEKMFMIGLLILTSVVLMFASIIG